MPSARPDTAIVDAPLAQGALLAALDAANLLIEKGETHPRVRYLRILSRARMGETAEALRELDEWALGEPIEDEDSLALRGRLLKDLAIQGLAVQLRNCALQRRWQHERFQLALARGLLEHMGLRREGSVMSALAIG